MLLKGTFAECVRVFVCAQPEYDIIRKMKINNIDEKKREKLVSQRNNNNEAKGKKKLAKIVSNKDTFWR